MVDNLESRLKLLNPNERNILLVFFSRRQISILLKYYEKLLKYYFYGELISNKRTKTSFLEEWKLFKSDFGISDDELNVLGYPKSYFLRFEPQNVIDLAALPPIEFCKLCRTEESLNETQWFNNVELQHILNKLGLEFIIINVGGNHFNLVVRFDKIHNGLYAYDPFGGIKSIPLQSVRAYTFAISNKIEQKFYKIDRPSRIIMTKTPDGKTAVVKKYSTDIWDYLRDSYYRIQDFYSKRLQFDSWNCGPLCIYAGINSGQVEWR
ncbi:hypothetical protein J4480_05380 [Candidatus Woesearchaeota archaeon]|nr:hypothetical protein [Candidatus Woesearchaeota archaeon]